VRRVVVDRIPHLERFAMADGGAASIEARLARSPSKRHREVVADAINVRCRLGLSP